MKVARLILLLDAIIDQPVLFRLQLVKPSPGLCMWHPYIFVLDMGTEHFKPIYILRWSIIKLLDFNQYFTEGIKKIQTTV